MDALGRALCTSALVGLHAAYALLDATEPRAPIAASAEKRIPRHVAFALIDDQPDEALERLRRIILWASEMRIAELSLWNNQGLVELAAPHLLADLASHPETPPSSSGSSSSPCSSSAELPQTLGSVPTSRVTSFTYWLPDANERAGMTVHLLPKRDGKEIMVEAARTVRSAVNIEQMDQVVRASLHFECDPDLLIVQTSSTRNHSRLARWLPHPPPELHGFPFWPLRITELYHVQPRLTPQSFSMSPLATSRKDFTQKASSSALLDREAWDHAIQRWQRVEQRLGR